MMAARAAGWGWPQILNEIDVSYDAMRARCLSYRKANGGSEVRGLDIAPAPAAKIAPSPQPVEHKRWLTRTEFMHLAGVTSSGTISLWRHAGLLPGTHDRPGRRTRYDRRDLDRILRAPRRGRTGVDRAAVLAAIESAENLYADSH